MAILRVRKGASPGRVFPLPRRGKPSVIGRDAGADIVLVDAKASRRNTCIALLHGAWLVKDMGSSNGTFVNARRIEKDRLADGAYLQVGRTLLSFHASELAPPPQLEIGGATPQESIREAAGVFVYQGVQAVVDREVRIDWVLASRGLEGSIAEAIRVAFGEAQNVEGPGIAPIVRAEADEGGEVFILTKGRGRPTLEERLPQILALPLGARLQVFRQIVELILERATWESLRSPIGLPHLLLEEDGGVLAVSVPPVELAALVAEMTGDLVHLPEHVPYLAPESIGKQPEAVASQASTPFAGAMYNLGAIGYHLLTGKPPAGEGSVEEILESHRSLRPAPASLVRPELPSELSDLLDRMLAKEPEKRPAGRQEVADALISSLSLLERRRAAPALAPPDSPPAGVAPASPPPAAGEAERSTPVAPPRQPAEPTIRPSAPPARRERVPLKRRSLLDSVVYLPVWAAVWVGLFVAARALSRIVLEALNGQ